jgi:hypothetical protein
LAILGIFTPAGSPSAAYLMPEVAVAYPVTEFSRTMRWARLESVPRPPLLHVFCTLRVILKGPAHGPLVHRGLAERCRMSAR